VAVPETSDVRHVVGAGIEGMVAGRRVRVGSPRFAAEVARAVAPRAADAAGNPVAVPEEATPVHVTVDGVLVAVAGVGDAIRADAAAALATLRARGWRTRLLSGDAPEVAAAVGRTLGFAPGDITGGASPEAKLAAVQREKARVAGGGRVVMVGDGVNDAAAMAAADVGIGVHGGAEACLATADIYLTRPGLAPLVELTEGAARTLRVIRRNIGFSIGYNLIGASLAVAGVLTPLIAAILMPTASVTVVLGSWLGFTFARERVLPEGS
jgi:Cu2+-exporting ATPase